MRILLDEARLGWDEAWDLTQRTLAYTNHMLLPEALEKWPLPWFELLLPHQLEIILEINRRLIDEVRTRFHGDEGRVARVSLVEEGGERQIRMANLAIVGSHSTNGVAAIHSELLRTATVGHLAQMFPERFNNKTNGVTPRRWLLLANPALAGASPRRSATVDDRPRRAREAQAARRRRGFSGIRPRRQTRCQVTVCGMAHVDFRRDRRSGLDLRQPGQAHPRIQTATAERAAPRGPLQPATANADLDIAPRTFFSAGKAAPGYHLAKVIIKFLNNLAGTIDGDPAVRGRLKVVFLPDTASRSPSG